MFGSRVKLNVCRASRFTLVGSGKGESGGSGAAAIKVEEHVAQTFTALWLTGSIPVKKMIGFCWKVKVLMCPRNKKKQLTCYSSAKYWFVHIKWSTLEANSKCLSCGGMILSFLLLSASQCRKYIIFEPHSPMSYSNWDFRPEVKNIYLEIQFGMCANQRGREKKLPSADK